jgi:UDP-N-acetylglucosamine:LPS N-acetylglucosamine transferase
MAYDHAADETFTKLIDSAKIIVARAGYSSIMDLAALKRTAWLVPTPGQTEQEYLAQFLSQKQLFKTMSQAEFNLANILKNGILENKVHSKTNNAIKFALIDSWLASL